MGSTTASNSSSVVASFSPTWSPEMLSITAIHLNGKNYPNWAKYVENYFTGSKQYTYLTNDPSKSTESTHANWVVEDVQTPLQLWNSMEPKLLAHLSFVILLNKFGQRAKELYSGVNNLSRTFDLYQTYFSLSLGDSTLEDYYSKFSVVCEELNICQPLSIDIQVMRRQGDNLNAASFLSSLPTSFRPICCELLEAVVASYE